MTSTSPTSVTILLGPATQTTTPASGHSVTVERPRSNSRAATVIEQLTEVRTALFAGSRVIVISTDLIAPSAALAPVTDDAFAPTTTLLAPDRTGRVTVRHHTVVSAGSSFHDVRTPSHSSVGALVIAPQDCVVAADAVDELLQALSHGDVSVPDDDAFDVLLVALVRGGVPVRAVDIVDVPWFRTVHDQGGAWDSVGSVSEARVRGLLANRVDDGFYSTFVVRKASKPLTRLAIRLGWSPNAITLVSFGVGLAAAASFVGGSFWWLLAGALLLQLSLVIDCVDGEVARATRRFSSLGAWLDAATDRVKEFAAYAGLAMGAARFGIDVWWIAVVLVVLQTTRHMSDYDFARIQRLREATAPRADVRDPEDPLPQGAGALASAMQTSARINRRSAVRWFKKVIHLPIGERWLILSVLAVVAGPQWALGGLLVAGALALLYVLAGRIARTLTWAGATPGDGAQVLRDQWDAGPIAAGIARVVPALRPSAAGRFAWSLPVALRALELGGIALLVALSDPSLVVAAFWVLFVIAYHHYDNLYRSLQGASPPRWLTWAGFGWDGRLAIVAALAITSLWNPTITVLLVWWAVLFGGIASVQWLRSKR